MRSRFGVCGLLAAVCLTAAAPSAQAADSGLDAYSVPATAANIKELRERGFDLHEGRVGKTQEIVATARQAQGLSKAGVPATRKARATGTSRRGIRPDGSYDVYRPYFDDTYVGEDADGNQRETLYEEYQRIAAEHPDLVRIQEIGRTLSNKPIIALRITKDVRDQPRGARPSVLYIANQHAREWITAENVRRQVNHLVDDYGSDEKVTRLVNTRELWYVPIANPDGYDFTFTPGNRLWRKNTRELNGAPGTQAGDGVDPNRNFPGSWGLDDEGSSPDPSSETYRGPSPASEAETQAIDKLEKAQDFKMLVNYHSAAELLLYGRGNYVEGEYPDDPIYKALSGTDADSAIKGTEEGAPDDYDPDISAELYTTNGDTDEYAYETYGILSWTPEMDVADPARGAVGEDGAAPSVFEFQDSDADLNAAFEKNLPFMEDVADSAADPSEPVSHLGNTVADFELRPFDTSYGAPQTVSVLAKRKLGPVTVKWQVGDGEEQSAPTSEFKGGERFGGGGEYFHEVRGVVTGAKPGDVVRVRFEAGGKQSGSFRYTQASDSDAPVLLLAAENQKGTSAYPAVPAGGLLAFDTQYAAALTQAGVKFDTWDVDARGGAPDRLGVLSHYKAVVWYTGNDLLTRNPGQPGGTGAAKFGNDITLSVRSYLNEGGKLLYTGQNAAFQNTQGVYAYNPQGEPPYCDSPDPAADYTASLNRCVLLSDDFLQYWVGAFIHSDSAGTSGGDPDADKADVASKKFKLAAPFGDADFTLNGGDSADNQAHLTTALTTSSVLGDRFKDQLFAGFEGPGAFSPTGGTGYAVAESDDEGWQRLRKTVDLTGKTSGALKFNLSYDAEIDYDYVFVEAHTVGQDDWTTLPDRNGNTVKDAGASCTIDWRSLHPFVDRYQTVIPAPVPDPDEQGVTCSPEGTTGEFNAATGNSGGYKPWDVDLSAYAGKQVELSITYAQDFAVSGLGTYLDDVQVVKDGATTETIGFEGGDTGGFTAGPPPEGSEEGTQGAWKATPDLGLVTGPGVATPDSVYLTFGFEGITEAADRTTVMTAAMKHLGVIAAAPPAGDPPPTNTPAPPAPPAPGPPGPKPPVSTRAPLVRFTLGAFRSSPTGRVPVRVTCSSAASLAGCTGTVSIRVGRVTYGSLKYRLERGKSKTVSVKLTSSALRTLKRRKSIKVDVRVTSTSAGRTTVTVARKATLKRPK